MSDGVESIARRHAVYSERRGAQSQGGGDGVMPFLFALFGFAAILAFGLVLIWEDRASRMLQETEDWLERMAKRGAEHDGTHQGSAGGTAGSRDGSGD